jgi:hypothetical protein
MDAALVELKHCRIESFKTGVHASPNASVTLTECIVSKCEYHNIAIKGGAVTHVIGCTVSDTVEDRARGLLVRDEGTSVKANKESMFVGNCHSGIDVAEQASVQLDSCTVSGNQRKEIFHVNEFGDDCLGCGRQLKKAFAESRKGRGVMVSGWNARVKAKDSTFNGNSH